MSVKFYIATSTQRVPVHNRVRDELARQGYEITYDWTTHGSVRQTSVSRLQEVGHLECEGIARADFVLVLLPGGKGTHVELGFALGQGKRLFIHSEDPQLFETGPQACAFYHHATGVRLLCPAEEVASLVGKHLAKEISFSL